MNMIFDQTEKLNNKDIFEDNLFVKNIIVNKNKNKKSDLPYIATQRWLNQLGERLETNN